MASFGFLILIFAIAIVGFVKLGMKECNHFEIPDQTGKIMIVTGGNSGTVKIPLVIA